jgi:starch synthase
MKVLYTAPNRGHHYRYASAFYKADMLSAFVSGFSRFSPKAAFPEIGNKLIRADVIQTCYLASLKAKAPYIIASELAFWAKKEQDMRCAKFIDQSDVFLFYNGSGLHSCKQANKKNKITIVEAVNSHVSVQEEILHQEYGTLNLPWTKFHVREKQRRLDEYDAADYILLPSDFVKKSFLDVGFPESKLLKVPFGFEPFNVSITGKKNQKVVVLFVGSISVRKGLRYLINAFCLLDPSKIELRIVGPETETSGIEDLTIPSNIIFEGILKGDALSKAYMQADVFCLPTLEEGMALVLGEALSFGLPIITTPNSGIGDLITNGLEGFIVPIRSSEVIAEKLNELICNETLLQEMKQNALLKSKTLNGWEDNATLLTETISGLLHKNK